MNKWKIAFWICFAALLATSGFGFYAILDQGVSLTYMRQGYEETKDDLKLVIKIINDTNLTKEEITKLVTTENDSSYIHMDGDTIALNRITLYFKQDRLDKIEKMW